jgi:hypothetical protein
MPFSLNMNPRSSALLRNDRSAPIAYSCGLIFAGGIMTNTVKKQLSDLLV